MKKLIWFLVSSVMLVGTVACQNVSKTSDVAPDTTEKVGKVPQQQETRNASEDAKSDMRQAQINSDMRAREQRSDLLGNRNEKTPDDLESLVRNNLEANLLDSQLSVDAEEGVVTIAGTVKSQEDLTKIEPLAKVVRGVKSVKMNVKVAPPQPEPKPEKTP